MHQGAMAKTLRITADHPATPGHFPGLPIVPGALLLQSILDQAGADFPAAVVCGVRRIKFLRMLSPDQPFWLEFESPGASGARFRVQTEVGIVAEGQLAFRTAE
jgi:3-hydroxymyristoyl/3-hydroxydecanoyl-(acyl carrier protein) dehydratase